MEAAHKKAGVPLTPEQTAALDTLDTLLDSPELQKRFVLQPGMVLITNDSQILHGRTAFTDHPEAVVASDENMGHVFKRTMERFWVKATE
jgi:alpha-ketoglutarate-dependent taurine dioxygenase